MIYYDNYVQSGINNLEWFFFTLAFSLASRIIKVLSFTTKNKGREIIVSYRNVENFNISICIGYGIYWTSLW